MTEAKCIDIHSDRIAVRDEGDGEALLLIHGMAGSSQTWRAILPLLAKKYRVIAPDLSGHGQSSKPRTDHSLGAFAVGLRDLLDELKVESATVVGHSLGGGIAMQFVYQHPDYCRRIVLISSGGLGPEVGLILRLLATPGAELIMPVIAPSPVLRTGNSVRSWLSSLGLRSPRGRRDLERLFVLLRPADPRRVPAHASVGGRLPRAKRQRAEPPHPARRSARPRDLGRARHHHPGGACVLGAQSPAGLPPRSASRCRALRTSRSAGESGGTHRRLHLDDSRGRAVHGAARLLA